MNWQDLLSTPETTVLPWTGGGTVASDRRVWTIQGRRPQEYGWYTFEVAGGRLAKLKEASDPPAEFNGKTLRGYLVGDRFIADTATVVPDPARLIEQTETLLCAPDSELFTRVTAFRTLDKKLVYLRTEWPTGIEPDVVAAYQDRKAEVNSIPGVPPALDLAFRWTSHQRLLAEERAREEARRQEEERRRIEAEAARILEAEKRAAFLAEALKNAGTAAGRRELARHDFETAARTALAFSGAELLSARPDQFKRNAMVVQYRFRHRRLECVCDRDTLRIIEAGVCLDDHRGTKGDTLFTLESLPTVIREAMDRRVLVVWRRAPGDREFEGDRRRYDDDDNDMDDFDE